MNSSGWPIFFLYYFCSQSPMHCCCFTHRLVLFQRAFLYSAHRRSTSHLRSIQQYQTRNERRRLTKLSALHLPQMKVSWTCCSDCHHRRWWWWWCRRHSTVVRGAQLHRRWRARVHSLTPASIDEPELDRGKRGGGVHGSSSYIVEEDEKNALRCGFIHDYCCCCCRCCRCCYYC